MIKKLKTQKLKKKLGVVGRNIIICSDVDISDCEKLQLGDHIYIGPGAKFHCRGGVDIADNVIIGPRLTIHSSNHNYESFDILPYDGVTVLKKVTIGANTWIGDNVMICPGVTIGEGAVIAMGAVVCKDVPPLAIVGGNPAKVIKMRNKDIYNIAKNKERYYLKEKFLSNILPKEIIDN
ncbi:acyltransferase [Catenovulum sp. 2E275]|uniref:acyltransferase n=1 Tax=Catenovulum sp. 2E275 TaxID=2980497 RepID=UPI0021D0125B|nr:acyltransferase [Catenovulum sp. 2E275]MCU4677331.1 acyltransferase [Catenovulum sp. 2E275]